MMSASVRTGVRTGVRIGVRIELGRKLRQGACSLASGRPHFADIYSPSGESNRE